MSDTYTVYRGYTHAQLDEAFKKVQDQEHWKNPIDSKCLESERDVTEAAIIFFAGSQPDFVEVNTNVLQVTAAGYYVDVGA